MKRGALFTVAALAGAATASAAWGAVGAPSPGGIDLQPGATQVMRDIQEFHAFLLPIIVIISAFVLALLLWVVFRYNRRANPTPRKFTHNMLVEVVWTVVPGEVTLREFQSLINWLLDHQDELSRRPLFDLKILISEILSDGRITDQEREGLVEFLERYSTRFALPKKILKPFVPAPTIAFEERTFQFTGPQAWLSQRKAIRAIKERGGHFSSSAKLTPKTDYLVIGTLSPAVEGTPVVNGKLRRALSLIEKGQTNVRVVTEADLVRSLLFFS